MGEYIHRRESESRSLGDDYLSFETNRHSQPSQDLIPRKYLGDPFSQPAPKKSQLDLIREEAESLRAKESSGELLTPGEKDFLDYVDNVEAALNQKSKSVEKRIQSLQQKQPQPRKSQIDLFLERQQKQKEEEKKAILNSPLGKKFSQFLSPKTTTKNPETDLSQPKTTPAPQNSPSTIETASPISPQINPQINPQTSDNQSLFVAPENLVDQLDPSEIIGKTQSGNFLFKTDNSQGVEGAIASGLPVKEVNDSERTEIKQQQKQQTLQSFQNVKTEIQGKAKDIDYRGKNITNELNSETLNVKSALKEAAETKKDLINNQVATIRSQLSQKATSAKTKITQQHQTASERITSETTAAKLELTNSYQINLDQLDGLEATIPNRFSAPYEDTVIEIIQVQADYKNKAMSFGQTKSAEYSTQSPPEPSNAIIEALESFDRDTYVTNWRKAKQDAAISVAESYQEEFKNSGQELIKKLQKAKAENFDGLRQAIAVSREKITNKYNSATAQLDSQQQAALYAADELLQQQLTAVDYTHQTNLNGLQSAAAGQSQLDDDLTGSIQGADNLNEQLRATLKATTQNALTGLNAGILTAETIIKETETVNLENLNEIKNYLDGLISGAVEELETGIVNAKTRINQAGYVTNINSIGDSLVASLNHSASSSQANFDSAVTDSQTAFTTLTSSFEGQLDSTVSEAAAFFKEQNTEITKGFDGVEQNLKNKLALTVSQLALQYDEVLSKIAAQTDTEAEKAAKRVRPAWKQIIGVLVTVVIAVSTTVAVFAFAASGGWLVGLGIAALIGSAGGMARTAANDLIYGTMSSPEEYLKAALIGAGEGILQLVGIKGATQLASKATSQFSKWAIATSIEGGADLTTDIGTRLATGQEITPAVLGISASGSLLSAAAGDGVGEGVTKALSKSNLSAAASKSLVKSSDFVVNTGIDIGLDAAEITYIDGQNYSALEFTKSLIGSVGGNALGAGLSNQISRRANKPDINVEFLAKDSSQLTKDTSQLTKDTSQTPEIPGEITNRKTESKAYTNKPIVDISNTTKDKEKKDKDNVNLFDNHPERARNLEIALRGNEKVPVVRDDSLEGNTVQVHYIVDKNGLVDPNSIHIKAGPSARNIDVMLHARTVSRLKHYSGLLGEVIKLKNQIKKLLGWRTPEIGSLAWEAMLKVDKLEQIIKHRMKQRTLGVDIQLSEDFDNEIADLSDQLARHKKTFEEMDNSDGVGYIAAKGQGRTTETETVAKIWNITEEINKLIQAKSPNPDAPFQIESSEMDLILLKVLGEEKVDKTQLSKEDKKIFESKLASLRKKIRIYLKKPTTGTSRRNHFTEISITEDRTQAKRGAPWVINLEKGQTLQNVLDKYKPIRDSFYNKSNKKPEYVSPYKGSIYSDLEKVELAEGWEFKTGEIIKTLDDIAQQELDLAIENRQKNPPQQVNISSGTATVVDPTKLADGAELINDFSYEEKFKIGETENGQEIGYRHYSAEDKFSNPVGRIGDLGTGKGLRYSQFEKKLKGLESSEIGNRLNKILRGEKLPADKYSPIIGELYGVWFAKEGSHPWRQNKKTGRYEAKYEHKRDLIYSKMVTQLLSSGQITFEEALDLHPGSYGKAQIGTQRVTAEMNEEQDLPGEETKIRTYRDERYRREKETIQKWFEQYKEQLKEYGEEAEIKNLEKFIKEQI